MAVQYSPLCDSDPLAYVAYCLASYGAGVGRPVAEFRGAGGEGTGGCGDDFVVNSDVVGRCVNSAWSPWVAFLGRYGIGSSKVSVGDGGFDSGSVESGESCRVSVGTVDSCCGGGACGHCGETSVGGVPEYTERVSLEKDALSGVERGKQWWKNQKRSKKRKMASVSWRRNAGPLVDGSGGCVSGGSDCGSVATVDTRTAVEIEASQTLAARRVAENRYEIAKLEAKTRSFSDESKTEALGRLEAARMEQRINQAIARSQKAYGETDKSLKSLGSTGSAGEFALKKEVKRGEEARIERDYLKEQVGKMLRFVPASVKEEIANMKPPVFPTDEEVFGDCPDSWSDTEKMDYYDEQVRHDEELAARSFDHRIIREPENVVFSPALQEDMRRLRDLTVFE